MLELSRLTWQEIQDKLPDLDVLLLPVGSIEQHGPHLPIDNDIYIARALAKKIAEEAKQSMNISIGIGASMPVGYSQHHMEFPGTVSFRKETYKMVLKDIIHSYYHHGITDILLINGHGGNGEIIKETLTEIKENSNGPNNSPNNVSNKVPNKLPNNVPSNEKTNLLDIFNYWNAIKEQGGHLLETQFFCHACEGETSFAEALDQRVLRDELIDALSQNPELSKYNLFSEPCGNLPSIEQVSASGVIGNNKPASRETGEKLLQIVIAKALKKLEVVQSPKVMENMKN
ncbi:creatininase family protein [Natranaerobius thermophilus]|uniref:Creatininase n=1 Tax=Natranaerobius thermophilus (strain ATCC BAA-1301 / DSM 18059 / JW/NM-WN-LF) TaxID=457570 RepID=B2A1T0_NATTJ|nr:creatininase family protein [Natranaerobius thermophilus]ACB86127.1 Creatininase [Natranaerobius thermophilus JW/NM-WN-LF]